MATDHGESVLGGKRNSRGGDFGKSAPDVDHALFSCEVKYRKVLPRLLRLGLEQAAHYDQGKPPLLLLKERYQRGALVVMRLADFTDLVGTFTPPQSTGCPPQSGTLLNAVQDTSLVTEVALD